MAKPGREAAEEMARLAALSRNATDLDGVRAPPAAMAQKMQIAAEGQLGARCNGCGCRIGMGFKFTKITCAIVQGKPTVDVAEISACNGVDGCDFAEAARKDATMVEMLEFVWLDDFEEPEEPEPDEPASAPVAEAGELADVKAEAA